jgi:hypothetical protein
MLALCARRMCFLYITRWTVKGKGFVCHDVRCSAGDLASGFDQQWPLYMLYGVLNYTYNCCYLPPCMLRVGWHRESLYAVRGSVGELMPSKSYGAL